MTNDILKEGYFLSEKIKSIEQNIKTLNQALSDDFAARSITFNIYELHGNDGYCYIPEKIHKTVCRIALLECEEQLRLLQEDFDKL